MNSERITGLKVNITSMTHALETIEEWIGTKEAARHVVTADASMAVIARKDGCLRDIVEHADLVTPDGAGILWASRLLGRPIRDKVSGVDLVGELCRLSAEKKYTIFFLGAGPGVAEEAATNLRAKYPGCCIVGWRDGYFGPDEDRTVAEDIAQLHPDVLLVALGIPKQEKWINTYKDVVGAAVSIGIGGSFDVYSGRVSRAPMWMQKHGLEWLYRLSKNPKKIAKVMTLPEFAMLTVLSKLGLPVVARSL